MKNVSREHKIYSMSDSNTPVISIGSGETVVFETYDCFTDQIESEKQNIETLDWECINPATGPVAIEGAEEGDTLKIEIISIETRDYGIMCAIPGAGLLGDEITTPELKIIPIRGDMAIFNSFSIPLNPMIGVIGVSPGKNLDIPCGTPGHHGGNMDNAKITAGSVLYLPVFSKGALLAMGDLHACMGDGEIMVSGVEVSGKVTVRIELIKNRGIRNPMLESGESIYTIASDKDLTAAVKSATKEMQNLLIEKLGMSFNESGMLLSAAGNAEICQVVDPFMTARFSMPKEILGPLF